MEFWTLILALLAGASGLYYFAFWNFDYFERRCIPHVKPTAVVGNLGPALFRKMPFPKLLQSIYNSFPDAKYVGFYDFSCPVVMIRDPELMKNIAIKSFDNFTDHRGFIDEDQDPFFGKNLFSIRGDRWRAMRTLLSPAFTSSKMKMMFKLTYRCAHDFAEFIAKLPNDQLNAMEMKDAFTRYTNDVIATTAFGVSVDSMKDRDNEFYLMGKDASNFDGFRSIKFFLLRNFPRVTKFLNITLINGTTAGFFKGVISTTIAARDAGGIVRPDMLQMMMQARDKSVRRELTIEDITAQAFIFFLGGFDTSSTLMCFAAHEIAVNPEVHRRLQAEVDAVLAQCDGEVTYEALHGMQYLDGVLNEALRMYPPVPFADRICMNDFELPPALPGLKPYKMESGTSVWFSIYGIHHDPQHFSEPHKFAPERFTEENKTKMIAFGLGPRSCIGNRFALMEAKLVLFHLMAKFNLKTCRKTSIPMKLSKKSFAMTAHDGFWLQLQRRE